MSEYEQEPIWEDDGLTGYEGPRQFSCPFCGCEAILTLTPSNPKANHLATITCDDCVNVSQHAFGLTRLDAIKKVVAAWERPLSALKKLYACAQCAGFHKSELPPVFEAMKEAREILKP